MPNPALDFHFPSPVSHLPFAVSLLYSLRSLVFHFPSSVSHLPFAVSLLSSLVFRLPFPDFCFLSLISCLPSTYLFSLVIPCKKSMWTEKKSDQMKITDTKVRMHEYEGTYDARHKVSDKNSKMLTHREKKDACPALLTSCIPAQVDPPRRPSRLSWSGQVTPGQGYRSRCSCPQPLQFTA